MTNQQGEFILGNINFQNNKQEVKSWFCLRQPFSRSLIVFLSHFCHFLDYFGSFRKIHFQETCSESNYGVKNLPGASTFYCTLTKNDDMLFSNKKLCLFLVGSLETEKAVFM